MLKRWGLSNQAEDAVTSTAASSSINNHWSILLDHSGESEVDYQVTRGEDSQRDKLLLRLGQSRLKVIVLFCLRVANLSFSAASSQTPHFFFLFFFFLAPNDAFIWEGGSGICSAWRSRHTFSHLSCAHESQRAPMPLDQNQQRSLRLPSAPDNVMLLSTNQTKIHPFSYSSSWFFPLLLFVVHPSALIKIPFILKWICINSINMCNIWLRLVACVEMSWWVKWKRSEKVFILQLQGKQQNEGAVRWEKVS